MWPGRSVSPSVEANNGLGNLLEEPSYYYKASPWNSQTPLVQQDVSTAYASSFDLSSINNMVLENMNQLSWSSENSLMDFSTSFNISSRHLGESHDLLSSPVNEQKVSKFPEREYSDLTTPDIEKFLLENNFGSDIWKYGKLNFNIKKSNKLNW